MLPLTLLVCALLAAVHGWGHEGHEITAAIAQAMLSKSATEGTAKLLARDGKLLRTVVSWADLIKGESEWRWTSPLHYVNTKSWECGYTYVIDCPGHYCVVGAINNYTNRLLSSDRKSEEAYIALKFIVHFVGDISQPMHVSFLADEGGSSEHGRFYNMTTNLHEVWDSDIISRRIHSEYRRSKEKMTQALIGKVLNGEWCEQAKEWASCPGGVKACTHQWASESAALACEDAYTDNGTKVTDGFHLGEEYYNKAVPIVEMQLARGGVRLAYLLNLIWPEPSSSLIELLDNNPLVQTR